MGKRAKAEKLHASEATSPSFTYTLLDRFPDTPVGHIEFIEWVRIEILDQVRSLRTGEFDHERIDRQLRRGVKWQEARHRLAVLAQSRCINAKTIGRVETVLRRDLKIGTVEHIYDLLTPSLRCMRDEWEGVATIRNPPGRRKADEVVIEREKKLADEWQKAREARVHKADFVRDHNMTMAELDLLLDRVRKRNTRSDK